MKTFFDKFFPLFFWLIIIAAASWGAWILVIGREDINPGQGVVSTQNSEGIPPAIVDQPILEEVTADGSVRWTLYLDQIVREVGSVMVLAKPRALYRFESGEILDVTGGTGTYDEASGILILSGGVTGSARESMFNFTVDEMTWNSTDAMLTAAGNVRVIREGIEFHGEQLTLNLASEFAKMEVTGGVIITSTPEAIEELIPQSN